MEAYAQLSAAAGAGVLSSQSRATAAVSRPMSDPYTTGSMFRPLAGHAVRGWDSPDGGDVGRRVFAAGGNLAALLNQVGTRPVCKVAVEAEAIGNLVAQYGG